MPGGDGPSGWDFLTLLTWWNLYTLPAALLAAGVTVVLWNRRFERSSTGDASLDGRRLVHIVALIHLGISVQAMVRLAQELLTMREMGVAESFANFIGQTISVAVNPLLALGFWRAWRWARRLAIGWYVLLSLIGVIVTVWRFRFHAPIDLTWWPDYFAGKLMPVFLLAVMFMPRVKRVFGRPRNALATDAQPAANEPEPNPVRRWSIISLIALLCMIIVFSNLAVDSADWIDRSLSTSELEPDDLPQ